MYKDTCALHWTDMTINMYLSPGFESVKIINVNIFAWAYVRSLTCLHALIILVQRKVNNYAY